MAPDSQSSFSLRPWPTGDRKPKTLAEFIARVNAQPGGFRNVTEEGLRKGVETQENGDATPEDAMSIDSEEDEYTGTASIEDIRAARDELMKNVEIVHQNAMMALESVSLLLSKETPVQASTTVSPMLRDLVGIGTLGAEKLAASNVTGPVQQDNKLVATGWKLDDINRSADSVLSSASRLQKEISLETKYWAEVLAVSEKGWSVSRLPRERHTLGVKFGFSEAAPIFRNNSVAPMRRAKDGRVALDTGRVGEPQRLLVTIERDGEIRGRSEMSDPISSSAPLEDRVLEARNTVFAQELWQEMNREGRNLLSYDVHLRESSISYAVDGTTRICFMLCNTDNIELLGETWGSRPDDHLAEALSLSLQILLCHAHHQNNRKRSQPHDSSAVAGRPNQAYPLLRPVIAQLRHQDALMKATTFARQLTNVLQLAGVRSSAYTLVEPPVVSQAADSETSLPPSEGFVASMLTPQEFRIDLNITESARLSIRCRTNILPVVATLWGVVLPPQILSHPNLEVTQQPRNPLQSIYPPVESYPNLREVISYVRNAVSRVLTDSFENLFTELITPEATDSQDPIVPEERAEKSSTGDDIRLPHRCDWSKNMAGTGYTDLDSHLREVRFQVLTSARPADSDDGTDDDIRAEEDLTTAEGEILAGGPDAQEPEIRVFGSWFVLDDTNESGNRAARMQKQCCRWTTAEAQLGTKKESLESVVKGMLSLEKRLR